MIVVETSTLRLAAQEARSSPARAASDSIWPCATATRACGHERAHSARPPPRSSRRGRAGRRPGRRARARARSRPSRGRRRTRRRRCGSGAGPPAASRSPRCRAGRRATSAACAGSASPTARARRRVRRSWRSSSFCFTPKRCSSSTITRPEVLRLHVAREQPVRADQDVDLALARSRAITARCSASRSGSARAARSGTGSRAAAPRTCRSAAARGSSSAPARATACRRRRP